MPLDRGWLNSLVDDSGAGLDGTVWNKGEITTFHNVIDAALAPVELGKPHAASHAQGGADPVSVLTLAGYPGGTAQFLRGDGTFAIPATPAVPALHAPTHAAGGTDPVTLAQSQITGLTVSLGGKVETTDPRLSDARPPIAHALTHASAGADALDVKAIGGYPGGTTLFLRADGTFAAPPAGGGGSGTPGGADTQIQFNDAGAFGGDSGLTYNKTTDTLRVAGMVTANDAAGRTVVTLGGYPGSEDAYGVIWLTAAPPNTANWAMLSTAGQTMFNVGNIGLATQEFRIGNVTHFAVGNAGVAINAPSNTTPTIPLRVLDAARVVTLLTLSDIGDTVILGTLTADGGKRALTVTGGFPGGTTTFLRADGTFAAPAGGSGSPGGATTQVQFNDGGAFGGDAALIFDKATGRLGIGAAPDARLAIKQSANARQGGLRLTNAAASGLCDFYMGGDDKLYLQLQATGPWFDWSAAGIFTATGGLASGGDLAFSGNGIIRRNTADGADNGFLTMWGGGAGAATRGGGFTLYGNENGGVGSISFEMGNVAGSTFRVWRAAGVVCFELNGSTGAVAFTTTYEWGYTVNFARTEGGFVSILRNGVYNLVFGNSKALGTGGGATVDDATVISYISGSKLYLEANNGSVRSITIYNDPSGAAVNYMIVDSDGRIRRSTSSARYKTAIEPLTDWRWLLDLTPIEYATIEKPEGRKFVGLTAEDVAAHGPARNGVPMCAGLNGDGQPEDVSYANLVAPLLLAVQELNRRVAALEG